MAIPIHQKMTVSEFDEFVFHPNNVDRDYEFIGGEIVEVVSNSYSSEVASLIGFHIHLYLRNNNITGRVTGADGGYEIGNERYIPDVAFTAIDKQTKAIHLAYNPTPPDLAVEVISPTDSEKSMRLKVVNYLAEGVVVWVVNPDEKTVEIYQPAKSAIVLGLSDTIEGGEVLKGFKLPVKDIFPPEEAEKEE